MNVLALELSSPRGSIACTSGAEVLFNREFPNDRKHSGAFFENLRLCLDKVGHPSRIVVGLGPGSYAGTRIAIAAATGLQVATGAMVSGGSSLAALEVDSERYGVIGDARREAFYFAEVLARRCIEGPVLCTEKELRERLARYEHPVFATETISRFPEVIVAYPSALTLTCIPPEDLTSSASRPLEPIYLREPHITMARTSQSLVQK